VGPRFVTDFTISISITFWISARTNRRVDTLIERDRETLLRLRGIVELEVNPMIYSRPSFMRLSLAANPCSTQFANPANDGSGYALPSEQKRC
jgi:hypothetical protein